MARPNAQLLSLRDPALAAVLGVIAMAPANFGGDSDFGGEFGDDDDMGDDDDYGAEFGDDDDYGADFGAAARRPVKVKRPQNQAQLVALWKNHHAKKSMAKRREMLLEPNKGSAVKIEKYTFTLSQAIVLGTAAAFTTLTGQPDTSIRPQRLTCNAPAPMFAFLQEIKVANVSVSVGSGLEDAYNYNANGVGQSLDMPTLSPANRATILGSYTGFVPPGFVGGTAVYFSASMKGPASIVA
jgi:hypothetical protein